MGWVNIGILGGLAAAAIPVIVHLLRSRRYEQADLGSLRFLRQVLRETARWRKLQNLLLFLCRFLIILLLTCLFARPFLTRPGSEDADVEVAVLADVSRSTEGRTLGGPVSGFVREEIQRIQSNLPEGARLTLAAFADDVVEIQTPDGLSGPPRGRTDYARALNWARDRLSSSGARYREIIVVTDMQASGLPPAPLSNWPDRLPVRVCATPVPKSLNLGIQGVHCLTPYTVTDVGLRLDLHVSGEPAGTTLVSTLKLDDGALQRETYPCRSGSRRIELPCPASGDLAGTVSLETDDAYPGDDSSCFAFRIRRPARVLLIEEGNISGDAESGVHYLETALRLARFSGGASAFQPVVGHDSATLSEYDVVVLCNPDDPGSSFANRLRDFVTAGGGAVLFLGDRTDVGACARLRRAGLIRAAIEPKPVPVPMPLERWDSRHPALSAFASRETGNLSRLVLRDAFTVRPETDVTVLAELTNGTPAMMTSVLGQGRVVVVTNPCDRTWTSWCTERIFVPLMRELFRFAAAQGDDDDPVPGRIESIHEPLGVGRHPGSPPVIIVPDPREMDMSRCDETTFRTRLGIGPKPDRSAWSEEGLPAGRERPRELWPWLALVLLVLLVCETFLADRGRT